MASDTADGILRALDFTPPPPRCETFVISRRDHCGEPASHLVKYRCRHCGHTDASMLCQPHRDGVAACTGRTSLVCQACGVRSTLDLLSIVPVGGQS